jgi:hypothetical protein
MRRERCASRERGDAGARAHGTRHDERAVHDE